MTRELPHLVYVGIKGTVVALDAIVGAEIWRTELRGTDYVSIVWDGAVLVAACSGEVWRLDPQTGASIWHNELRGMGRGYAGLSTTRGSATRDNADTAAAQHRLDEAQAAAS